MPSASGLQRSAVVGPLGQFVRGKDVTSVGRTGEGRYLVVFRRNVQGCAYVASLGDPSVSGPPVGQAGTSGSRPTPTPCRCAPVSSTGNAADRPFHLIVSC